MIVFHIDVMLAKRKMSLTELSERVGITLANLSILKTGKARAVRMETLDRLCAALDCQPGDLWSSCRRKRLEPFTNPGFLSTMEGRRQVRA